MPGPRVDPIQDHFNSTSCQPNNHGSASSNASHQQTVDLGNSDGERERHGLKFYYTNSTSLMNKLNELKALVDVFKPDIVAITETWFDDKTAGNIAGYNVFRRDRGSRGGGVAIYVSDQLESSDVTSDKLITQQVEQTWCVIKLGKERLLVGCIYRPTAEADARIFEAIAEAARMVTRKQVTGMIVLGDFNYSSIDWSRPDCPLSDGKDNQAPAFIQALEESHLSQMVDFPTFQTSPVHLGNTLDLLITDEPNRVYELKPGPILGKIEHAHLSIEFKLATEQSRNKQFRSDKFRYRSGRYEEMSEYLRSIEWTSRLTAGSMQQSYDNFLIEYSSACNRFIPTRHKATVAREPWMTKDIKALIRKKREQWYSYLASSKKGHPEHAAAQHIEYKRTAKATKRRVDAAVQEHELQLTTLAKDNPKLLYAYINKNRSVRSQIRSMTTRDGNRTTEPNEIANILNDHFESVFNKSEQPATAKMTKRTNEKYDLDPTNFVSEHDLSELIRALDSSKSMGRDGVSPFVLKSCADAFATPLRILFTKSLACGQLPEQWRTANVTPLFKKGSKMEASNYRPVSLTSVPCKLMERVVKGLMTKHLHDHGLIAVEQHGFVANRACVTNLLETQDIITRAQEEGLDVDVLYTDFSKAFDRVPTVKLIDKLKAYGFGSTTTKWIASFLSDRSQRVVLGETESESCPIRSGVVQGSVLGPLLFIIYINDLPAELTNTTKIYADDGKIICILTDEEKQANTMQRDIDKLKKWCHEWEMQLNRGKCTSASPIPKGATRSSKIRSSAPRRKKET